MNTEAGHSITSVGLLYIFILALFPWLVACTSGTHPPIPPISLALDVQKAGRKNAVTVSIIERQTYAFELQYFFKESDPNDRAKAWRLAGGSFKDTTGNWVEPGAPLTIKLKISGKSDKSVYPGLEKEISNPHLTSWGNNNLDAKLANVLLDPGIYEVSVENLTDAPQFQGEQIALRIARAYLGK